MNIVHTERNNQHSPDQRVGHSDKFLFTIDTHASTYANFGPLGAFYGPPEIFKLYPGMVPELPYTQSRNSRIGY